MTFQRVAGQFQVQRLQDVCTYDVGRTCPLDCGARLSRRDYDTHLRYVCPRRSVACEFCCQEFTSDAIDVSLTVHLSIPAVTFRSACADDLWR